MEKPLVSKALNPHALSEAAQDRLAKQLYKVHTEIFDGVDYSSFKNYILAPKADRTRIHTFTNRAGEAVGYIAIHDLLVPVKGRRLRIIRTEVGLQRAYRGHNLALRILLRECIRAWFQNYGRNLWFMATPVHPNPYCSAANQMAEMYPRTGQRTPTHIQTLMEQLGQKLQLETPQNGLKWQRKVGWQVRNTAQERKRLEESQDPNVQFYLRENPHYGEGCGLMMLIPCHIGNGVSAIGKILAKSLRRGRKAYLSSRSSSARSASPSKPLSFASTKAIRSSTRP